MEGWISAIVLANVDLLPFVRPDSVIGPLPASIDDTAVSKRRTTGLRLIGVQAVRLTRICLAIVATADSGDAFERLLDYAFYFSLHSTEMYIRTTTTGRGEVDFKTGRVVELEPDIWTDKQRIDNRSTSVLAFRTVYRLAANLTLDFKGELVVYTTPHTDYTLTLCRCPTLTALPPLSPPPLSPLPPLPPPPPSVVNLSGGKRKRKSRDRARRRLKVTAASPPVAADTDDDDDDDDPVHTARSLWTVIGPLLLGAGVLGFNEWGKWAAGGGLWV